MCRFWDGYFNYVHLWNTSIYHSLNGRFHCCSSIDHINSSSSDFIHLNIHACRSSNIHRNVHSWNRRHTKSMFNTHSFNSGLDRSSNFCSNGGGGFFLSLCFCGIINILLDPDCISFGISLHLFSPFNDRSFLITDSPFESDIFQVLDLLISNLRIFAFNSAVVMMALLLNPSSEGASWMLLGTNSNIAMPILLFEVLQRRKVSIPSLAWCHL
mmetsp:Transcript_14537/g.21822  ORF Transcript_14537/g.21822 Transcript_14537/m.21822 type:complete len:213 (+) Transcript_14537:208-846(+)